ncbi:MAG: transcriptional repressor NrdR [candidate division Zixibacteria bacterium]|jgi:transcriptional repressor NrdR|nr:transcriptional repressor NrdR [candidate division Zixibacteria bacterium]NIR62774.1 transcriptional repressor NrdR [candidate division Zixibacteria bacterium]NIS15863.1 transcriptional repressor NrdR [candidate division Zixibacteria bacterium]NIS44844.1 transcriptional repressor NrdR [candidate division Zixibacteria bacterium]NIT52321.1 transcriptional repressor NrdR [candidate division Zixibacteria bacterium]
MRCPFCGHQEDKVVDSRTAQDGRAVRRRRECLDCGRRFTTYEYVENLSLSVVKRNQARELYDRTKLRKGIELATNKRPVSIKQIDDLVTEVENEILDLGKNEVSSEVIGELVMKKLKDIDEVAYVRFASVYRKFQDKSEFYKELKNLIDEREK